MVLVSDSNPTFGGLNPVKCDFCRQYTCTPTCIEERRGFKVAIDIGGKTTKMIREDFRYAHRNFFTCLSTQIHWLAEKLDFFEVYDIKWGYLEWKLRSLKVLLCCFLSYVNKGMTLVFQMNHLSSSKLKRLQNCDLSKLEI